jgi:hypothetical protein
MSDDEPLAFENDFYHFKRPRRTREAGQTNTTFQERSSNYFKRKEQEEKERKEQEEQYKPKSFEEQYFEEQNQEEDDGLTPDQRKAMEEELRNQEETGQEIPLFDDDNQFGKPDDDEFKFHEHYQTMSDDFDDYVEEFIYQNFMPREINHQSINEILTVAEYDISEDSYHGLVKHEQAIEQVQSKIPSGIPSILKTLDFLMYKKDMDVDRSQSIGLYPPKLTTSDEAIFQKIRRNPGFKEIENEQIAFDDYKFVYTHDLSFFRNLKQRDKEKYIVVKDFDDNEFDQDLLEYRRLYNENRDNIYLEREYLKYLLMRKRTKFKKKILILEHPAQNNPMFKYYFNEVILHQSKDKIDTKEELRVIYDLFAVISKNIIFVNKDDEILKLISTTFNYVYKKRMKECNIIDVKRFGNHTIYNNMVFIFDTN